MTYLFFLGRKTELARCELETVLRRVGVTMPLEDVTEDIVRCECPSIDLQYIQDTAGGVVKTAEVLEVYGKDLTEDDLVNILKNEAEKKEKKKLAFSVYEHGKQNFSREDLTRVKKALHGSGLSARYIESGARGLSAAQLLHHDITELVLLYNDGITVAVTKTVQDIDAWSLRDYGKPYRDPRKGMLPPKVARMLVNLGIEDNEPKNAHIYDPFCGSGTVLMEANIIGADAAGSDLSPEAVEGAKRNIAWLKAQAGEAGESTVFFQDAVHVVKTDLPFSVDAIVTEPFLGKPNPVERDAENILRGLSKMYLGVFKAWRDIVVKDGKVVVVFPQLKFGKHVKTMSKVIDMIETLGYTREKGPLIYDRPQTVVQRAIYVFKYTGK